MSLADFDRLAWERIDGTITDEDVEILEQMMAVDPAARRRFDELCRMADELALAGTSDPPPELRPRIDRALQSTAPRWRRRSMVATAPSRRFLYAAAGVVVGAVIGQLLIPASPVDRSRAAGAMVPRVEQPAGALEVDLGHGTGSASLWSTGPEWTAEIALTGERTVELVFEARSGRFDVHSMTLEGSVKSDVTEEPGRLVLDIRGTGRTVATFQLSGRALPFELTVLSDGQVVDRRVIETEVGE